MSSRPRLVVVAVLIAVAVLSLRARELMGAPDPAPEDPAPGPEQGGQFAIELLALIAVPFLALLLLAALRFPRERRPKGDEISHGALTRRQLLAIAALIAVVAGLAVLASAVRARFGRPPAARSARPPGLTPPAGSRPPPSERRADGPGMDFEVITALAVGGMLIVLLAALIANRRPRRADGPPADELTTAPAVGTPSGGALADAAAHALSTVDAPAKNPREAIIRCYAALEEALGSATVAVPRPADTPSDVLRRASEAGLLRGEYGERLLSLFTEARFSSHPMSEHDRAAAAGALRHILDDLRRPAWTHS